MLLLIDFITSNLVKKVKNILLVTFLTEPNWIIMMQYEEGFYIKKVVYEWKTALLTLDLKQYYQSITIKLKWLLSKWKHLSVFVFCYNALTSLKEKGEW